MKRLLSALIAFPLMAGTTIAAHAASAGAPEQTSGFKIISVNGSGCNRNSVSSSTSSFGFNISFSALAARIAPQEGINKGYVTCSVGLQVDESKTIRFASSGGATMNGSSTGRVTLSVGSARASKSIPQGMQSMFTLDGNGRLNKGTTSINVSIEVTDPRPAGTYGSTLEVDTVDVSVQ